MVEKRGRGQPPKPPELKRKRVIFTLSPQVIKKLETVKNRSRLVEKLLIEYFDQVKVTRE